MKWPGTTPVPRGATPQATRRHTCLQEFYVGPVYNESYADGLKHTIFDVDRMWGLGVPDDLEYFEANFLHQPAPTIRARQPCRAAPGHDGVRFGGLCCERISTQSLALLIGSQSLSWHCHRL